MNGESALYLGRNYRIEITDSADEIRFEQKFIMPRSLPVEKKTVLRSWYIKKAHEKIIPRTRHFANVLGVEYADAKIVDNKYRWGSCTPKDNLNFNWRLIKAPMFVIDYVIIHELAHLLVANHTPEFWNVIRAQTPKMDTAKEWLRENGQLLEEEI